MLDPRQLEPALTEKERLLRDAFVSEYLRDFNAFRACLRLGFQATYATHWSDTLFNDGYVQRKIAFLTKRDNEDDEELALIKETLKRVMLNGSDSARASAAHKYMILKGWDKGAGGDVENEDLVESFRRIAEQLPA